MAPDQYLILLCDPAYPPVLSDDGWDTPCKGKFPLESSKVHSIISNEFTNNKIDFEEASVYEQSGLEIRLYYTDGSKTKIEAMDSRVSLLIMQEGQKSELRTYQQIMNISSILAIIGFKLDLGIFDSWKGVLLKDKNEILEAIMTSRAGKLYNI